MRCMPPCQSMVASAWQLLTNKSPSQGPLTCCWCGVRNGADRTHCTASCGVPSSWQMRRTATRRPKAKASAAEGGTPGRARRVSGGGGEGAGCRQIQPLHVVLVCTAVVEIVAARFLQGVHGMAHVHPSGLSIGGHACNEHTVWTGRVHSATNQGLAASSTEGKGGSDCSTVVLWVPMGWQHTFVSECSKVMCEERPCCLGLLQLSSSHAPVCSNGQQVSARVPSHAAGGMLCWQHRHLHRCSHRAGRATAAHQVSIRRGGSWCNSKP